MNKCISVIANLQKATKMSRAGQQLLMVLALAALFWRSVSFAYDQVCLRFCSVSNAVLTSNQPGSKLCQQHITARLFVFITINTPSAVLTSLVLHCS